MSTFIVEAKDPKGNIKYVAFGPMVEERAAATQFTNEKAAHGAILRYRGANPVFWNSERESAKHHEIEFRHWTFTVHPF